MGIYNMLYFYISMFCIDICNKQPLEEVLHSVEICFVTSLHNLYKMACMTNILYRLILGEIYEYAFYVWAIWDTQTFNWRIIAALTQNHTVLMFVDITGAPKR